jgi:gamma-glutamyltranspeptidase/glutathione hydrolase
MSTVRPVYGRNAAICCGHPAAAAAGWEALARGGSIADAALAAAAVLTVVLPQAVTIGGDGFFLYHDSATGKTYGLNASGRSPAALDADRLTAADLERGPLSCGTPGLVAGWEMLHQRFGRLPWADPLRRAIDLAGQGFPASPGLASQTAGHRALLEKDPGASAIFLKNGAAKAGAMFRQPALAATLERIAQGGAKAFYHGPAAESIGRYVQSRGGALAASDFAACMPEWVEPLRLGYRDLDVCVMPPNSFGLYMLLQLAALSEADFSKLDANAPERYAALIAAARSAFAAGDRSVADPAVVGTGLPAPLSEAGLKAVRADFRRRAGPTLPNKGGTTVIAMVDDMGNAAAIVQSVFLVFGSGVADPESGVLMNDRLLGFTLEKGHPNVAAPGKRPAHTLNPVITFDKTGVRHVLLTPGGPGQTLTLTQVLQATTDHGLPLHEAVALPRWSMDLAGEVILEADMPQTVFDGLNTLGVAAARGARGSPFFGSAECVERLPGGGVVAVADHRREAHAIAV